MGAALGDAVDEAEHLAVGWGNENWRIESRGARFIAKFGPPGSAAKWGATHGVYELATTAGLPVPTLVHFEPSCAEADGWVLRIFTWMEGRPAADVIRTGDPAHTFFEELAATVDTLHELPAAAFSSRLDGSAPAFERWSEYIEHRLTSVLDRVRATAAFTSADADAIVATITELAVDVDATARPAVCHRDLYLDNLLATPTGSLAAILDFDGAEAWDPAIDVVKLRWLVFPHHPGSEAAFLAAYGSRPQWDERVRLAELLELLNAVPNAVAAGDPVFEASARGRLAEVLRST